tara:strand:- start:73 stop:492 length:420 start_codon:yes stop_codon:yes gene_type:complete
MTPEKMAKLHLNSEANHRIWDAREFAEILSSKGVFAESHEHGFAIARLIDFEAELILLVTDKFHQNNGLASNCLIKIEKKIVENGGKKLILEVSESNKAAIKVYERLNYKKVSVRKLYSRNKKGKFENALVMQKDLLPI